jgi:hypothetical protein
VREAYTGFGRKPITNQAEEFGNFSWAVRFENAVMPRLDRGIPYAAASRF